MTTMIFSYNLLAMASFTGKSIMSTRLQAEGRQPKFFLHDVRDVERLNPSSGWLPVHEQIVEAISMYGSELEIVPRGSPVPENMDGVFIGKHTRLQMSNCWNLKKAYIPNYFYFDRTGYAGWAEMAHNQSLFEAAMQVDASTAEHFFECLYDETVRSNLSKEIQSTEPFYPPPRPFVFLPLQLSFDSVMQLSRVDHFSFYEALRDWTASVGLCLVLKPHPFANEGVVFGRICESTAQILSDATNHDHVYTTTTSIHAVIPLCEAVICINSGVGFEGLIHCKPVITAGHSDYHWAAHQISSVDELARIETWRQPLLSTVDNKKFLYFFLCKYLIDLRDSMMIQQCIARAIHEFQGVLSANDCL
jgi:hypothetical protein